MSSFPKADFFVAPNGNDDWSGELPTPNAQGNNGPFATLQRAQRAVRDKVRQGLTADVKVLIRAGMYYLPTGLTFTTEDTGTVEHRITYAAYPGEHPQLIGGIRLTHWQPWREGIWRADLPAGIQPTQVFENGVRMAVARAPKQGYFRTVGPAGGSGLPGLQYHADDLDALDSAAWNLSNAQVSIWPQYNWFNFVHPIAALDVRRRTIRLRGDLGDYKITAGNRYAVLNVLALLTQAGECQIDLTNRVVYVWPIQLPIDQQQIVVSSAEHVIAIEGRSAKQPVRNVHFEGLDIRMSNDDAVRVTRAEDCSFRFCKIENGGRSGVRILGHAQRIVLYGNLIRQHGYCGVSLEGLPPGMPDVNHHHRVENNHIHHCGRLIGHGAGVYIEQSGHNWIVHNHVHHMPRYGTTIKGLRYQLLREQVAGVTWDNHYDFLHSRHNVIAFNHIHHVNQDSQDTGAMESWGPGRDNVYDHNLVHNSGNTEFDLQSGMYLDDATDYFTVTNNIIWGIVGTSNNQPIFAKGIANRIENNILIVGDTNDSAIMSMEMAGEECKDHVYQRNIVLITHRRGALYKFINWRKDRIQVSDYNLIWKAQGNVFVDGISTILGRWDTWRGMGFDANSVIADPQFIDLAGADFRLGEGSPAFALGFVPIDVSQIGLRPDFPRRFESA
ncbi:MAG: right-handed parallel beta-helix repeat-containing protein [Anaerolineae bacterium]|nr:right-handed parallel beta-helix repeat-containing protein [Thermoflexales bacterium]MDW8407273.1 right-handed parallel beta-helix repeat-containing protein [Anaerolineae bacterium]